MKKVLIFEDDKIHAQNFKDKIRSWNELEYDVISNESFSDQFDSIDSFRTRFVPEFTSLVRKHRSELEAIFLDLVFVIGGVQTTEGFYLGQKLRETFFEIPIIIYSQLKPELIVAKGLIFDLDGYIYKTEWGQYTAMSFRGLVELAVKKRKAMIFAIDESKYFHQIEVGIQSSKELIFVMMPFDTKLVSPDIYEVGIQGAIDDLNESSGIAFECVRVDEDLFARPIMDKIFTYIKNAAVIVAVLSGRNPNVFYELGIAHQLNKDVIMLTNNINDVPFDVRDIKCLEYSEGYAAALKEKIKSTLKQYYNLPS